MELAGAYNVYNDNGKSHKEYTHYVDEARKYAKNGIVVDALDNYTKALKIKDDFDLRLEAGEVLSVNDQFDEAVNWGIKLAEEYPNNPLSYEYLMQLYYDSENYASFFEEYDVYKKRSVSSKIVEKMMTQIEYSYFTNLDYDDVKLFSDGYSAVAKNEVWGYVNEKGKKTVDLQFQFAGAFHDSLAPVTTDKNSAYFINGEGNKKLVAPADANAKTIGSVKDHVYTVFDGTVWNIYSEEGDKLAGGFTELSAYGNGAFAAKRGEAWSIIDKKGKALSKQTFENICINENGVAINEDRVFALVDGDVILFDSNGKEIKKTSFESAVPFLDDTYAAVQENGSWGFVDKNGEIVIEPQYEGARSFSNGFAAVKQYGKWGFISKKNKIVIEPAFQEAKDFSSLGSVFVRKGDNWTLLRLYKYNHK